MKSICVPVFLLSRRGKNLEWDEESGRKEGNILGSPQGTQRSQSLPQNRGCVVENLFRTRALQPRASELPLLLTRAPNSVYHTCCCKYLLILTELPDSLSHADCWSNDCPWPAEENSSDTGKWTVSGEKQISMRDSVSTWREGTGMKDDFPISSVFFEKISYSSDTKTWL